MDMLLICGGRAMRSLFAPGMFGVFILSVIVTVASLIGFVVITSTGLFHFAALFGDWGGMLPWIGTAGASVMAWFLFPGIMPFIVSFFDVRIATLIEQQDYPDAIGRRDGDMFQELAHDVRFAIKAIFLNILVLPLYLLPVINLFLFYLLNGYLLGREFFLTVARRHMTHEEAETLRKRHGRLVLSAGAAIAFLATIPLFNLVAPFWGIAIMVHLYQHLTHANPRRLGYGDAVSKQL